MTKWHVKDLSKLTGISVQTLHYYDHINLLKPSGRLSNGYRIYSEKDLLCLQQIVALKFFGFELSKIKLLLVGNAQSVENFSTQALLLEKKQQFFLTQPTCSEKLLLKLKLINQFLGKLLFN